MLRGSRMVVRYLGMMGLRGRGLRGHGGLGERNQGYDLGWCWGDQGCSGGRSGLRTERCIIYHSYSFPQNFLTRK